MSIIFGIRRSGVGIVSELHLQQFAAATGRYALDGLYTLAKGRIGMACQPYRTHQRSNLESIPIADRYGNILTVDGRLDNYLELAQLLGIQDSEAADSRTILTAFERWGEKCFSRFIGDWAIALWSEREQTLYLARDHAGTRTLYFELRRGEVLWSTYLETFFVEEEARQLDETYIIKYLACQPCNGATPYAGILPVKPGHYFAFHERSMTSKKFWDIALDERILFRSDTEYEEKFLSLFRKSVERRTGPGSPILAQLSGGMDSSAIVCMSDAIRKQQGLGPNELLDTVSFFDDSEPNWDEKPYFRLIEEHRGKRGFHIDQSNNAFSLDSDDPGYGNYLFPGADRSALLRERELNECLGHIGYRVVLSGIGGDELLGGRPDPLPELADHLRRAQLGTLLRQSFRWSLETDKPLYELLQASFVFTWSIYMNPGGTDTTPPWIRKEILNEWSETPRLWSKPFKHLPSTLERLSTWEALLASLPHQNPDLLVRREYRFPFLDRDLVEFLLRIPCSQLLRPGHRRSLMRRSLQGIVPNEILNRRRKAYVIRRPLTVLQQHAVEIENTLQNSMLAAMGFIEPSSAVQTLRSINRGRDLQWIRHLLQTVLLEFWLRRTATRTSERNEPPIKISPVSARRNSQAPFALPQASEVARTG